MREASCSGVTTSMPHLELHIGNDGTQVGVAGAFAVAVYSALHLGSARLDSADGVGHAATGIIVRMDTEFGIRQMLPDGPCHIGDLPGEAPTVCLTENEHLGPGLPSALERRQRVGGVLDVGVEEMLGIQKDAPLLGFQVGDAFLDDGQILIETHPQHLFDVRGGGLRENRHDLRPGA